MTVGVDIEVFVRPVTLGELAKVAMIADENVVDIGDHGCGGIERVLGRNVVGDLVESEAGVHRGDGLEVVGLRDEPVIPLLAPCCRCRLLPVSISALGRWRMRMVESVKMSVDSGR